MSSKEKQHKRDRTSVTTAASAFKTLRIRCWQLWEDCSRKADVENFSYEGLLELQEETLEFLNALVALTQSLERLERENKELNTRVSESLRKVSTLRRQKSELEARLNEFGRLCRSPIVESLKLQPPWKLLNSYEVDKAFGPRIAGLVTRTMQTENQAWELEAVRKRSIIYGLGQQLQKSRICAFDCIHYRHCVVYNLANTLYNIREMSDLEKAIRIEDIQLRQGFQALNMASVENSITKPDMYVLYASLGFHVKRETKSWRISIEESFSCESSYTFCSCGSLKSGHPMIRIDIEPRISQENIRKLQCLLSDILQKEIWEQIPLVTSELHNVFVE